MKTNMRVPDSWSHHFLEPPKLTGTLFWLHGTESPEELRKTFDLAVGSGIGELTLESRPHWDYLGPKWWSDLKLILGWCREAGVSAYLFDEKWYPSGVAGNTIQKLDPAFRRSSIRLQYIRYRGPLNRVSLMPPWTHRSRSVVMSVFAYPMSEGVIGYEQGVDLTERLHRPDSPHMHGIVHGIHWDAPSGEWIVCFVIEDKTDNYIDPLHPGAVQAFIDRVYESSKREVGAYFGNPVRGFFFDEPAYFNHEQEIPWGYELRRRFIEAKGYDPIRFLPALWLKGESKGSEFFIYDYYDFLNKAYADTYCRPIHEWCRNHGLKYIGHWYEHEASPNHGERYMFHERTTEGPGDFFEVSRFADEGGIDVVCNQIIPGHRNRDYWGLPKLASSAAHVYGLKDDLAMSETFGAYGWHLGLRMMKWLTDWQAVRGINHFILHAFNPKWPDLDCPPYFFDGGLNPQWPYFSAYIQYVNRLSYFFREGRHVASLLLLYPGALGYAGESIPIEDVQQVLQENQYDYDLVPQEELLLSRIAGGRLELRSESYAAVVVPGTEVVTEELLHKLHEVVQSGVPVMFVNRQPARVLKRKQEAMPRSPFLSGTGMHLAGSPSDLPELLRHSGISAQLPFEGSGRENLRILHRIRENQCLWMVSNEDVETAVDGWIRLPGEPDVNALYAWEPLTGERWHLRSRISPDTAHEREFHLRIPPYRSLILIPSVLDVQEEVQGPVPASYIGSGQQSGVIDIDSGQIHFDWQGEARRGLPSWLRLDPSYSGTLAYTWTMEVPPSELEALNRVILDLGQVEEIAEVEVNGTSAGFSFVPPYRFDVTSWLTPGLNRFKVCVTNVVSNLMSMAEVLEDAGPDWKERREQFSIPEDGGLLGPVRLEFHHTIGSERNGYRQ